MATERDDLPSVAGAQATDARADSAASPRGALLESLDVVFANLLVVVVGPLAAVLAFVAMGSWILIMIAYAQVWAAIRAVLEGLGASAAALATATDVIAWVAFLLATVGAFFVTRWSWRTGKRTLLAMRARVHTKAAAMLHSHR